MFPIQHKLHNFEKKEYNQNTVVICLFFVLIWDIRYLDAILTSVNIIIISYHDQFIKKYINLLRVLKKQRLRKHWVIMICLTAKKKGGVPNKNRFLGSFFIGYRFSVWLPWKTRNAS